MTVNTEDIYRAMGYAWCRHRRQPTNVKQVRRYLLPAEKADDWNWWTRIPDAEITNYEIEYAGPDPLTDWSAFGEILEWAEKWLADDWIVTIQDGWSVVLDHVSGRVAHGDDPDFRRAVLAALSEAVRE